MNVVRTCEPDEAVRALLRALLSETRRLLRTAGGVGACGVAPTFCADAGRRDAGGARLSGASPDGFWPVATAGAWQRRVGAPPWIGIALSGGATSDRLFEVWTREFARTTPWEHLHFFWADERCVPPDHAESNYGQAQRLLFARVPVPPGHVHRIRGEAEPATEAARYASLVAQRFPMQDGVPVLHFLLLGIGPDGHTASVFPGDAGRLFADPAAYAVSRHPQTGQARITVTGRTMLHARHTWCLATGPEKQILLEQILHDDAARCLPAARVLHTARDARLFASFR